MVLSLFKASSMHCCLPESHSPSTYLCPYTDILTCCVWVTDMYMCTALQSTFEIIVATGSKVHGHEVKAETDLVENIKQSEHNMRIMKGNEQEHSSMVECGHATCIMC